MKPIAERVPFDPAYDLTRYEAALSGDVCEPPLDMLWLREDGTTVTERELLEAEGGIGGPDRRPRAIPTRRSRT